MKLRAFCFVFPIIAISLTACAHYAIQETESEQYLRRYLDAKEIVFEDICVQMGTAYWNAYTREAESDLETPKQRFRELYTDSTLNMLVDLWFERRDVIEDPILKRRIEVWHNILTGARVEMDDAIFDLKNELEMWLLNRDSLVARPSREELEEMMLELMELRNMRAKQLGFENFADLVLEITDIGSDWFYELVETIDSATLESYERLVAEIRQEKTDGELEFSDVWRLFMQYYVTSQGTGIGEEEMPELMAQTLVNLGIDYDVLSVHLVEKDLPGGVGGQSFAIRIPDEFRVVVMDELSFYDRMHELGHGMQWTFTTVQYPVLKGYEWCLGNDCGGYSEGLAETIAKFVVNREWQRKYTDVDDEELLAQEELLKDYLPVFLRGLLARSMVEIEFYRDLAQDYQEVRERVFKKYLLLDKHIGRAEPLANIVYVSYPVYVQSYLIAEIMSWQIHQALKDRFGSDYVFDRRVGDFLIEHLCAQGMFCPWKHRLSKVTGKEFDINGYFESHDIIAVK
jgi:hypothetical protein